MTSLEPTENQNADNTQDKVTDETNSCIPNPIELVPEINQSSLNSCDSAILDEIRDQLNSLSEVFQSKLQYDKHKDSIIDKLHAENQKYKEDLYRKMLFPVINDIVFLLDDYASLYKSFLSKDPAYLDPQKLLNLIGGIAEDLENILNKNGVDAYVTNEDKVNYSKQRVLKVEQTNDQALDKSVKEVLRKGFIWDDKIIRQEQVVCFKYDPTLEIAKENTSEKENTEN